MVYPNSYAMHKRQKNYLKKKLIMTAEIEQCKFVEIFNNSIVNLEGIFCGDFYSNSNGCQKCVNIYSFVHIVFGLYRCTYIIYIVGVLSCLYVHNKLYDTYLHHINRQIVRQTDSAKYSIILNVCFCALVCVRVYQG